MRVCVLKKSIFDNLAKKSFTNDKRGLRVEFVFNHGIVFRILSHIATNIVVGLSVANDNDIKFLPPKHGLYLLPVYPGSTIINPLNVLNYGNEIQNPDGCDILRCRHLRVVALRRVHVTESGERAP